LKIFHNFKKPINFEHFKRYTSIFLKYEKKLLKEAGIVLTGLAISSIGNLISLPVLTSLLPPGVFGDVALCLTLVTILQYSYNGTGAVAVRYYAPSIEKRQFSNYLTALWKVHNRRNLILSLIVIFGFIFLFLNHKFNWIYLGFGTIFIAVISAYGNLMDGIQLGARKRSIFALHQGVVSWLRLGCIFLFVSLWGSSTFIVICAISLATLVIGFSQRFFYYRIKKAQRAPSVATDKNIETDDLYIPMKKYGMTFLIQAIPLWIYSFADRWALKWFTSSAVVGNYAALYQLSFYPITAATQLIYQFATPILFERAGDAKSPKRVESSLSFNKKLIRASILWSVLAVIFVFFFKYLIANIFLDKRYHGSINLLPFFVLSAGIFATRQIAELPVMTFEKPWLLNGPRIYISLFFFLGNLIGARAFGLGGVVWGGLIINLLFLIWVFIIVNKLSRQLSNNYQILTLLGS
jgi:O-antigen/teichoic acid export membrane protein